MHRIAVFARRPVPAQVKTRLTPALPAELACALYEGLLADVLAAVGAAEADERWLYWDRADGPGATARPANVGERAQTGGDLGERMAAACAELLAAPGDRALIVGADHAGVRPGHIAQAFAALEAAPVALAPADDGGYGLIALARPAPALFDGIAWSTATVLEQTLARAVNGGLQVAMLEPLHDVDEPDDVARLIARLVRDPDAAGPATRAALHALGMLD